MSNKFLHKKLHKYGLDSERPPDWLLVRVRKMVLDITGLTGSPDWKTLLDAAEKKLKILEAKPHPSALERENISCLDVGMGILKQMVRLNDFAENKIKK